LCRRRKEIAPKQFRSETHTDYITIGGKGVPYVFPFVNELHPNPAIRPGMEYRSSLSWFNKELSLRKFRAIPFVSKSGKFSLHTLCVWKSYPEQVLLSLISTVYSRILKILVKRFKIVSKRVMNIAFKTSIIYTITRDNWIIDRFLGMARHGGTPIKKIESFIHFCVYELDANKRFVYSQAYFQANWLKFQVFRPCDKSNKEVRVGTHLRNLGFSDVSRLNDYNLISSAFQRQSCLWRVDKIVSGNRVAHYHLNDDSSESQYGLSELTESNGWSEDDQSQDW